MRARTENASEQQTNDTTIRFKINEIDAEAIVENVLQHTQKTIQHGVQLKTKNIQKHKRNDVEKQLQKETDKSTPGSSKIPSPGRAYYYIKLD